VRSRPGELLRIFRGEPGWKTVHAYGIRPPEGHREGAQDRTERPDESLRGRGNLSDGTTFALTRRGEPEIHIRSLSLSGEPDQEFTLKGWPNLTGLDWSPDGKGFYCGSVAPQGQTLLYLDLKGNAKVLWRYDRMVKSGACLRPTAATSPYMPTPPTATCGCWRTFRNILYRSVRSFKRLGPLRCCAFGMKVNLSFCNF
jgi:hypothetical protein